MAPKNKDSKTPAAKDIIIIIKQGLTKWGAKPHISKTLSACPKKEAIKYPNEIIKRVVYESTKSGPKRNNKFLPNNTIKINIKLEKRNPNLVDFLICIFKTL